MATATGVMPDRAVGIGWAALFTAALVMTVQGIMAASSYWYDELFSVVHMAGSLENLWRFRSDDVHPPAYPFLLFGWMKLWGPSEIATRSMSALFVFMAAASPFLLNRRFGSGFSFAASALIVTSPYALFYAQETRDYGMLLFASTLSLCAFLDHRRRLFFLAALATGTIHYFGTALTMILLTLHWLRQPKSVKETMLVAALVGFLFLWPIYQVLRGTAGAALRGTFWITTTPGESVVLAAKVLAPQLFWIAGISGIVAGLALGLTLIAILAILVRNLSQGQRLAGWKIRGGDGGFRFIAAAGLLVILAVAVISIHSPIALERNYIILVPIQALLIASLSASPLNARLRTILSLLLLVYCAIGLVAGNQRLRDRYMEDWRGLASQSASLARTRNLPIHFYINYPKEENKFLDFYLPASLATKPVNLDEIGQLPERAVLVFAGLLADSDNSNVVMARLAHLHRSATVVRPPNYVGCRMGIILIPANDYPNSTTATSPSPC